jgi:hypothetical protein
LSATTDLWIERDPTVCPDCDRGDACELHLPPVGQLDSGDHAAQYARRVAAAIEAERARREARRIVDAEERGRVEAEAVTLAALLKETEPVTPFRIDAWQPADSRVILAAPRKAGKTTLVGSLVRSLVDGDLWLGRYDVRRVRAVGLVDTEMSRATLRRWYRDQALVNPDRVVVFPLRGRASSLDLLDRTVRAEWRDRLQAHRIEYLIVDCLRPVLDALGLDESREAGRWLVGFDALLREADVSEACVVHHHGHNGERSRGDSRLRDWPDVEWSVIRQSDADNSARFIRAYGRDVDISESQLLFDMMTRRLAIAGGTRRDALAREALDAVVAVLNAPGAETALSGRAIKEALADSAIGKHTVDAALRLGTSNGTLAVQAGPRNARLYRLSVSRSVPECPAGQSTGSVSQCPAPLYGGHTGHTSELPLATESGRVLRRDTQPDGYEHSRKRAPRKRVAPRGS